MPLLPLPDIRQRSDYDCGVGAVKAVCDYLGRGLTYEELTLALYPDPIYGTSPRAILKCLRDVGLKVMVGEMGVGDLWYQSLANRPVICPVTFQGEGHYVVSRGVSEERVYYLDPADGYGSLPVKDFLKVWKDKDRWGRAYVNYGIASYK